MLPEIKERKARKEKLQIDKELQQERYLQYHRAFRPKPLAMTIHRILRDPNSEFYKG